jgi:hypothetical protein
VMAISVAQWSKAWVRGCSLAGIAGSNPTGVWDICVVCCRGISDMKREDIMEHNG